MCLGIPGRLLEVYEQDGLLMGKVEFGGIGKEICLALTPEAQVGQYVLVHAGVAISQVDEEEAQETFDYLEQIAAAGELEDLPPDGRNTAPNDGGTAT